MDNLNNKEYITIGTPIITKEIFRETLIPLNNYSFKPSGGFYASEHINNFYTISPWFRYLKRADGIARYKNINQSTIFTLKETAKILYIDSLEKVLELAKKYPSYHHKLIHHKEINSTNTIFDFETLAEHYDGIYVNVNKFYNEIGTIVFDTWRVNSLLLFNLDCIKEFRTAPIDIDKKGDYLIPNIKEEKIKMPEVIKEESYEHKAIIQSAEDIYLELMDNYQIFKDYDQYLSIITNNISKLIPILSQKEEQKINEIIKYLHAKGINISKEHLIENFSLNCLSKYLKKDRNRIKTLERSKTKEVKRYSIY